MKSKVRKGPNFRKRLMKKNLIKSDLPDEDDSEPLPPKEDGKVHVNWAEDLEKILDFDESEEIIFTKKPSSESSCCKSILKKTKFLDPSEFSETECSSTASDMEHLKDSDHSGSLSSPKKKAVTSSLMSSTKDFPSYKYPNKKLLCEILSNKKRRLSCFVDSRCKILCEGGA